MAPMAPSSQAVALLLLLLLLLVVVLREESKLLSTLQAALLYVPCLPRQLCTCAAAF